MRWFKHLTDASDDEFIHAIENQFGWEGYGRWWKLCEAIGRRMKKNEQRATAVLPVATWLSILKAKRKQLEMFLEYLQNQHRITVKATGDILEISMPKLLKYRDEYQRKSGQTPNLAPDFVPPKNTETENREQKKLSPKVKSEVPENWWPTGDLIAWATTNHPGVNWREETTKFIRNARAKGYTYKRHGLAWQNWISGKFVGKGQQQSLPRVIKTAPLKDE